MGDTVLPLPYSRIADYAAHNGIAAGADFKLFLRCMRAMDQAWRDFVMGIREVEKREPPKAEEISKVPMSLELFSKLFTVH